MSSFHPTLSALALTLLLAGGCSMPTVPGFTTYYQVTDPVEGTLYYTRDLERGKRGVVEFRDGATGSWVSLAGATVTEIDEARYREGVRR